MNKRNAKITFEMLRKDATVAADLLERTASVLHKEFALNEIAPETLAMLRHLALMLKGATHIVIHDTNELPED